MKKHKIPAKFDRLSIKKPQSANANTHSHSSISPDLSHLETKSMSTTGISCLIQKSLENLLKKENFFKSPDLTRISNKEKNEEFAQKSMRIRLANKSAEYQEIPFHTSPQVSDYEKYNSRYQTNIINTKGYFLYTQNPLSRKGQIELIEKVRNENMNWEAKAQYSTLLNKPHKIHKNGKITIIKELKDRSMAILNDAMNRKCQKEEFDEYKSVISKNIFEMEEINEKLTSQK